MQKPYNITNKSYTAHVESSIFISISGSYYWVTSITNNSLYKVIIKDFTIIIIIKSAELNPHTVFHQQSKIGIPPYKLDIACGV